MKPNFVASKLNFINEEWGTSPDDFIVQAHCEITCDGQPGGEAFIVNLVSPKRLEKMLRLGAEPVIGGHDFFIMENVNEGNVLALIQAMLYRTKANTWKELIDLTSVAFQWI